MGECEVCGAMKVSTRRVTKARSIIEVCQQCMQKMGIEPPESNRPPVSTPKSPRPRSAGGYGGKGRKGKDIMVRRSSELRSDYASAIRSAREQKGWDQKELAKRMAERVNIIQHTEGGKRPTDAVISKFERILGIKLMVERAAQEESVVSKSSNRPMTMEDLYNQAKKEMRGD